jgi:hypothetical protein
MCQALTYPSSGVPIVFTRHVVPSLSVTVCTVHGLRADSVQTFTEGEDTRYCVNTIFPAEGGYDNARNISRIIM